MEKLPEYAVCPVAVVMVTVADTGRGTLKLQFAWPFASCAVWPLTATVEPTKASAVVACALCSIEIRVCSWLFCFTCCSTCANDTSCWVNWLVSSGSSGFWFFNCVVSSCRNVSKLPAMVWVSTAPVTDAVPVAAAVWAAWTVEVIGVMAAIDGSSQTSDSDIDGVAGDQHAPVFGRDA